ncbi:MAG TPA: type II toxin-antitoxin system HicB family antitoxin [Xanthobacteraceae bacterium]|jgi:antitoxin HicB|nr:type II toxin-antitoxin system HicB family antitoxin [Xanthobacteraceae bacterium]
MRYPVNLSPDDDGSILVTFPDIPEALTRGVDVADALSMAVDALETALRLYMREWRDFPIPSQVNGRETASLGLRSALKVAIYRAIRMRDWRKPDLARALDADLSVVDQLLDLRHASTVAEVEAAFTVCGVEADIMIFERA